LPTSGSCRPALIHLLSRHNMEFEYDTVKLLQGVKISRYSSMASFAFLVYDHSLTFSSEVELFWKTQWSLGKVLFILNRYLGIINCSLGISVLFHSYLPPSYCLKFFHFYTGSAIVGHVIAETILITRIYALFDRNKKVLAIVSMFFLAEKTANIFLAFSKHITGQIPHKPPPSLPGCWAGGKSLSLTLTWLNTITFQTILLILTLYKGWEFFIKGMRQPLLEIVVRDSALYYFSMLFVLFANFFIGLLAPVYLMQLGISWSLSVPCVIGSRLLLHMREVAYKEQLTLRLMSNSTTK